MFEGARHLQNAHPLFVHFPIAFLPGAALFYFAAWILRKEKWAETGFWMLFLGVLSLAGAVATGLYAEGGVMVHLSVREHLLRPHKRFMIAVSFLCVLLTVWALAARPFPKKGRILFLFIFAAMIGLIAFGADYGARLVYEYNAGGTACPQPILFRK